MGAQAFFLVQVLLDRAADHLALERVGIDIADGFSGLQPVLAAWHFHFDEFVALTHANFADAAILIDGAAGHLLQIVTVLHGLFFAADAGQPLNIDLHPRGNDPRLL